jgi:hypothetical protein
MDTEPSPRRKIKTPVWFFARGRMQVRWSTMAGDEIKLETPRDIPVPSGLREEWMIEMALARDEIEDAPISEPVRTAR